MSARLDPVRLTVFHELFAAVAEEMGEVLRATAPSVNIRERRDYSCAIFDEGGRLVSQAAHIPVHLGSASLSVAAVRARFPDLAAGDAVLLNDPYAGGTHLPDLTLVSPVLETGGLPWYVVTRAHHSDVGGSEPGSMAPAADLLAEGFRVPPVRLLRRGQWVDDVLALVRANTRTPDLRAGDLRAQVEANRLGTRRLQDLWARYGRVYCGHAAAALSDYTARLVAAHLGRLRSGRFRAEELIEGDDGRDHPIVLDLEVARGGRLSFDFRASAEQVGGSMNANPAVTLAAVLYVLCCLVPDDVPVNAGLLRRVTVETRRGSLLDPVFPAAVAGGNVETSQRLVDVCFAAVAHAGGDVPAQSAGTMNNLAFGGRAAEGAFAFYETIGGGAGATSRTAGGSGVHTHMTNTRNTPVEECELLLPIVVERYTLRRGSGGAGRRRGGDGIVKEIRALVPLRASLLAERRRHGPRGYAGGGDGRPGGQRRIGGHGCRLPSKGTFVLAVDQSLRIETPGGGGHGARVEPRG